MQKQTENFKERHMVVVKVKAYENKNINEDLVSEHKDIREN